MVDFNVNYGFLCMEQELAPSNVLPDNFLRAIEYSDYSSVNPFLNLLFTHLVCFNRKGSNAYVVYVKVPHIVKSVYDAYFYMQ